MNLWQHQRDALKAIAERKRFGLFFDMGTGKTRTAIEAVRAAGARRILVLAPLAVVPVWPSQIARWWPRAPSVTVLEGSVKERAAGLPASGVVVVNYDAAWREPLGKALQSVAWDAVIADEAHRLKAHNSKVSKWAAGLKATMRLALTGTPFGQNELDAFGIFRFVNPSIFGTLWTHFRSRYAVLAGPHKNWIRGVRNTDELRAKIVPWSMTVQARDVLDLPAETDTVLPVTLSPQAMKAYRDFERDMLAWLPDDDVMDAANALVKALRLMQLAGGVAHGEESGAVRLCSAKLEALAELLDDLPASEPVVVFGQFSADVEGAADVALKAGRAAFKLTGDVKENAAWDAAARAGQGAVLCCQMRAGGLGVDLTAARICVYMSTGYSVADYAQSRARTMRAGQTRNVAYYHIRAQGTIDDVVATALAAKQDGVAATMAYLKGRRKNERVVGAVQGAHA